MTSLLARSAAVLLLAAALSDAQEKKLPRWEQMDYGSFVSSSLTMPWSKDFQHIDGVTVKSVAVRLDSKHAISFDTNLCRVAAGWTGGFVKLYGTPFDGTHRPPEKSRPSVQGTLAFRTAPGPTWTHDGDLRDPRSEPYIPLPRNRAQYRGLYVNGDRVVFSYTVGPVPVLEIHGVSGDAFSRTLKIGPSTAPLTLVVADVDQSGGCGPVSGDAFAAAKGPADHQNIAVSGTLAAGLAQGAPAGSTWEFVDGKRLLLQLPALPAPTLVRLVLGSAAKEDLPVFARILREGVEDPEALTKGGPARFEKAVVTKGVVGTGDAAYVVDTLTLPDDNPWKSWMRIGGFDFFADGRAAVSTWNGDVWIVSGIDATLEKLTWRRYAAGLFQPLGLKIVDDAVYVLGRDQITRLRDLNGDGEADAYECFNNMCGVTPNFHEFALDLHTDPEGSFYFTKGAPLLGTQEWDPITMHSGTLLKVSKDGQKMEIFATGLRAPNGSAVGPNGEVTCSDNEGIWTPACRLNWVRKGSFQGAVGMHHTATTPKDYDKPLCWLPKSVDNSSGGQVWVTSDKWGPYQGQLLHLSYGTCSLYHVLPQKIGDDVQGGVVRFPLTFASGIMRARFSPVDGQLYVAGLKGWQTSGAKDGTLQRVRFTGKPARGIAQMAVTARGADLTFTDALDRETATNPESYSVQAWNYVWSKEYGSPEFSPSDPKKKAHDEWTVTAAKLSEDRKTVSLEIAGLRPVMQMQLRIGVKTADGAALKLDVYNTIHRIP